MYIFNYMDAVLQREKEIKVIKTIFGRFVLAAQDHAFKSSHGWKWPVTIICDF